MNVLDQALARIEQMRGVLMVRNIHSAQFETACDELETLARACLESETPQFDWINRGFTPTEARILALITQRPGRVVKKSALVEGIYFDHLDGGPDSASKGIGVHIFRIRKKLSDLGLPMKLETVHLAGYRMVYS